MEFSTSADVGGRHLNVMANAEHALDVGAPLSAASRCHPWKARVDLGTTLTEPMDVAKESVAITCSHWPSSSAASMGAA